MELKRGFTKSFLLEILNSKLVVVILFFVIFSLVMVLAGNVIVKEGTMNVSDRLIVGSGVSNGISVGSVGSIYENSQDIYINNSGVNGDILIYLNQNGTKRRILDIDGLAGNLIFGEDGTAGNLVLESMDASSEGGQFRMNGAGSYPDWVIDSNANALRYIVGGNVPLYISNNTKIGIGDVTPNQSLDVNGNVQAVDFITTSDRNKKQNINELDVNSIFSSTPKLYEYQIIKEIPIFNEETGEITYTQELHPKQVGLMSDEVPEQCQKGEGIDIYCMLSLSYVKIIKQQEEIELLKSELCGKDDSYSWC